MKNTERATAIANSVKEMLDNPFNILSDVKAIGTDAINVRIVDNHAEYVKKLLEVNYCESLVFVTEGSADGVTTLTYNC